ncbi:hypothetical protein [Gulbenkiania mobilis]|uniref:hypothetical protein n=1 Tax=Gulbenkiania mobilis TaxID=397457 RepID=UPI0006BBE93B|nr:hypothetical protein [Gulbenkiania mobilis]
MDAAPTAALKRADNALSPAPVLALQPLAAHLLQRIAALQTGIRLYNLLEEAVQRLADTIADAPLRAVLSANLPEGVETPPTVHDEVVGLRAELGRQLETAMEALARLDVPAAQPSADAERIGCMLGGLVEAAASADTPLQQVLFAAISVLLADSAGWAALATLAEAEEEKDLSGRFRLVSVEEAQQAQALQGWLEALMLAESGRNV